MGAGFADTVRSLLPGAPKRNPGPTHVASAPQMRSDERPERRADSARSRNDDEEGKKDDSSVVPEEPRTHGTPETMLGASDPNEEAPKPAETPDGSPTLGATTGDAPDGADSSPTVSVRTAPTSENSVQGSVTAMPSTEISRGSGKRKEIALTFDAGSDYRPAKKILEALKSDGVTSTFFLTGEWVKENPKTTKRIAAEGHEVGNHSWDHAAFTDLSNDQIREQLNRTEEIIFQTSGKTSRPYFRPPLGARDERVRKAVADDGYLNIYWSLDSRDSVDKGITAAQIKERVLKNAAAGGIVLLHCGSTATAEALPEILKGLRQQGYSVVPLSRLLAE